MAVQPRFRSLIPLFTIQLNICNRLRLSYFKWNEDTQETSLHASKWRNLQVTIPRQIHLVYALTQLAYFMTPTSLKKNTTAENILGFLFIAGHTLCNILCWVFYKKQQEVVLLWNSFLTFEKKYLPRNTK